MPEDAMISLWSEQCMRGIEHVRGHSLEMQLGLSSVCENFDPTIVLR